MYIFNDYYISLYEKDPSTPVRIIRNGDTIYIKDGNEGKKKVHLFSIEPLIIINEDGYMKKISRTDFYDIDSNLFFKIMDDYKIGEGTNVFRIKDNLSITIPTQHIFNVPVILKEITNSTGYIILKFETILNKDKPLIYISIDYSSDIECSNGIISSNYAILSRLDCNPFHSLPF